MNAVFQILVYLPFAIFLSHSTLAVLQLKQIQVSFNLVHLYELMLCTAVNLRRSPTVSEEYKLKVFEATVLKNRFGSKINEVANGKHRLRGV
jgi:hypothetical protein